ncbi:hypothetical protein ACFLZY_03455 [Patescibacteria group bacterium]
MDPIFTALVAGLIFGILGKHPALRAVNLIIGLLRLSDWSWLTVWETKRGSVRIQNLMPEHWIQPRERARRIPKVLFDRLAKKKQLQDSIKKLTEACKKAGIKMSPDGEYLGQEYKNKTLSRAINQSLSRLVQLKERLKRVEDEIEFAQVALRLMEPHVLSCLLTDDDTGQESMIGLFDDLFYQLDQEEELIISSKEEVEAFEESQLSQSESVQVSQEQPADPMEQLIISEQVESGLLDDNGQEYQPDSKKTKTKRAKKQTQTT